MKEGQPRIAVIIRNSAEEALRMAVGYLSLFEGISVFIMDHALEPEGAVLEYVEALGMLGCRLYSNRDMSGFELIDDSAVARMLLKHEKVITY